ncbi:MAG: S-layer homology domain-containing protein [Candidatus Avoscillospira sp.]
MMKHKRILALILTLVLCLSIAIPASAASTATRKATDFSDFNASAWYAEAVSAAVDNGLLIGKSARILDPNGNLTRAEMAAVINRAFGAYKTTDISAYKDVSKNAWYYSDIQKAVWMGTYEGQSSTVMAPEKPITRQEIMTVVARALYLDLDRYADTDLSKFPDAKQVSDWALPYVRAMVGAGYIQGRDTGLAPQDNITRAEFAQVFYNIISQYIVKSGSFNGSLKGNLLIRSGDVTLKNATIDGDLIIGNGAADGKITLSNVKITGRLVVWGGGTKAVCCNDGTDVSELIVCRVDGPVKVIFDRDSTLKVYDKIDVEITERAKTYPETEVIFYDISDLLEAQKDLNAIVEKNQIQVTVSDHLYALVGETEVKAQLENRSETDTYRIELRLGNTGDAIAEPVELAPGKSVKTVTLLEAMDYGNYDCTAVVTAFRNGEAVGSMEIETTLHVAYLWAEEG